MSIEQEGFEIHPAFLDNQKVREIIDEIESLNSTYPKHGIRNAEKKLSTIKALVESDKLINTAACYLSGKPQLVRAIIFDKTPDKNWLVTWHQDKTITVNDKVDVFGWGPWTIKDGVHHVRPDFAVLADMVTLRIHLDLTNEDNGCLKLIPRSHKLGILSQAELETLVSDATPSIVSANPGDLLIMRPHLLHSSSKGSNPSHRRIVHLEFSSFQLPQGLVWA